MLAYDIVLACGTTDLTAIAVTVFVRRHLSLSINNLPLFRTGWLNWLVLRTDSNLFQGREILDRVTSLNKGKGKGHFYLTSVVPSVPTRLLSMETDGATISAPFYGYSKL